MKRGNLLAFIAELWEIKGLCRRNLNQGLTCHWEFFLFLCVSLCLFLQAGTLTHGPWELTFTQLYHWSGEDPTF